MADAKEFFRENSALFSDPHSEPEKYNLYGGLIQLAKDIEEIKRQVNNISYDVDHIKRNMK